MWVLGIWSSVCMCQSLSCVRLFATLWTIAPQAPPSMGFSRQEYWSGLPFLSPGDLPEILDLQDPGIESGSPALQADSLLSEPPGKPIWLSRYQESCIAAIGLPWLLRGKESACNAGNVGLFLGLRRSSGEGNDDLSSILVWKTQWTEKPGGLQFMGS